jgi:DNA-binding transcriptional LysR family regulator
MKLFEPLDIFPNVAQVIDIGVRSPSGAIRCCKTRTPRISLKQWNMFHAVIDYDGFDGAADQLHVTQSTVSHAVAKLQEQLGVALLELKGRKAQITAAGQCLLEKSRELVRHANALEALADTLHQGWGPDVRVAMDPGFPSDLLIQAVRQCSPSVHDLRLSISEVTPEGARRALHAGEADIVIGAQPVLGFAASFLLEVEHIAVAHPAHPLFSGKRDITHDELDTHSQVVIAPAQHGGGASTGESAPYHPGSWRVCNPERAIGILRQGVGYAWLPRYQVQQALDARHLRALPLSGAPHHGTRLYLMCAQSVAAGSVARQFADALHACSARSHHAGMGQA